MIGKTLGADVFMLTFRIVHILAGVAWVGSLFLFVVFVQPSSAAIAPAGAPLMAELLGKRKLVDRIIGLAVISVVGGLFLYWRDWHTYPSFIGSAFGLVLTLGAVASLIALGIGISVTRPNVLRLLSLGRAAAESGGPTPEMGAEMAEIQDRLKVAARVSLALLGLSVLAMATARYW